MQYVYAVAIAHKRGRQIETESVHVHFHHPITKAVDHQLQDARMQQVKRVARPGEIQIETRFLRMQPVVCGVVDSAKAERRTEMVPFRGMVVNHIQNDFDAGSMESAHHRFELGNLFAHVPSAGVLRMRRKKTDRIVTPVIR